MKRIAIIGASCSGKSTLAKKLSERLNCDNITLDELHWLPNWVERDDQEFVELVKERVRSESWVCDGNYSVARAAIWPHATTLIWLNYSFSRVFYQALKRAVSRIVTKEKLFHNNVETFRLTFMSKDSILLWVITSYRRVKSDYRNVLKTDMAKHLNVLEFNSPKQTRDFLDQLK